MELYRGDLQVGHPSFAEGSQAATQQAGTPVEISAPKIVYSKEDDDAIDEFHRRSGSCTIWILKYSRVFEVALISCHLVETTWHSVCE